MNKHRVTIETYDKDWALFGKGAVVPVTQNCIDDFGDVALIRSVYDVDVDTDICSGLYVVTITNY